VCSSQQGTVEPCFMSENTLNPIIYVSVKSGLQLSRPNISVG